MKAILLFGAVLIFSTTFSTMAQASVDCSALKSELSAMKEAQGKIISSLVSNHETFASTMEEYADIVTTTKTSAASKKLSQNMDQSAQAFRSRGVQSKHISERLTQGTSDLFTRVAACLK